MNPISNHLLRQHLYEASQDFFMRNTTRSLLLDAAKALYAQTEENTRLRRLLKDIGRTSMEADQIPIHPQGTPT